jgi:hypothetical protein
MYEVRLIHFCENLDFNEYIFPFGIVFVSFSDRPFSQMKQSIFTIVWLRGLDCGRAF